MNQTKVESFIEASVNTTIGFGTAFLTWQFIAAPVMGYTVTLHDNLVITSIFTVVSVMRGYVCRRFFNAGLHRVVHQFVRRLYATRSTH